MIATLFGDARSKHATTLGKKWVLNLGGNTSNTRCFCSRIFSGTDEASPA